MLSILIIQARPRCDGAARLHGDRQSVRGDVRKGVRKDVLREVFAKMFARRCRASLREQCRLIILQIYECMTQCMNVYVCCTCWRFAKRQIEAMPFRGRDF